MTGETNLAAQLHIATESDGTTPDPQNTDLDASGFGALSYTEIPDVGNVGDTGASQQINTYETWGNNLTIKQKGVASGQSVEIRVLNDTSSNGLTALKAAAAVTDQNNYVFRVTWNSGAVEYLRGIVHSKRFTKGNVGNFREFYVTLDLNQEPVEA